MTSNAAALCGAMLMCCRSDRGNTKALKVISRIQAKLAGKEFMRSMVRACVLAECRCLTTLQGKPLDVKSQVEQLIKDATNHENLCQHYTGWCPFW